MIALTLMRDRFVRGWPRHELGDRAYLLPLERALTRTYSTDAHFAAYETPRGRRLTREALDQGIHVPLTAITFDIDCAAVHGTPEPAPQSWRAELLDKVRALGEVHPSPFLYMTKGGARIIYLRSSPAVLRTQVDAQKWSQDYVIACVYFERRFGIAADLACTDWTRLFRLPHATRDPGGKPERWPTFGDPSRIGTLRIDASSEDVETARRSSKAFRDRKAMDFEPCTSDGSGLLYHLLQARGAIGRAHGPNAFVVRCPREAEHSTGRTGDGSTLLYLPARGERVGAIHCMHAHCSSMTVRDWLRTFAGHELEAAERAAGITRAA